ncbi:MAG: triose-phosphate isomerase [Chloroherpetonaceae bacterium]|nr:triose-phosphate isomerase [Chloroherpetonaceae bacterium]MCS7211755.1 triose-phosphate isomerase [Chloroherpetonaceae bacterium]MDW8018768.1 triose-phosphate isomerase [Chloroherpetonaceae bacterium]MDW8465962.1 triose-phosphate isomerase [Chloroherpetonaceae bacterium]
MRKKFVAGNWKMNKTVAGSIALASEVARLLGSNLPCEVALAPTFVALESVHQVLKHTPIKLAAQNCHYESDGAYTGEISAEMLRSVGCEYVILGHSERRQYFGETDEIINRKVKKALSESLKVILCIGETLAEREANQTEAVLEAQLSGTLKGISADEMAGITIAYEPVWAIGTGKTATPEQAEQAHQFIRAFIGARYSTELAERLTIQYGGSVKSSNARELFSMPNIDGGLIGGASLKAEEFVQIVRSIAP